MTQTDYTRAVHVYASQQNGCCGWPNLAQKSILILATFRPPFLKMGMFASLLPLRHHVLNFLRVQPLQQVEAEPLVEAEASAICRFVARQLSHLKGICC